MCPNACAAKLQGAKPFDAAKGIVAAPRSDRQILFNLDQCEQYEAQRAKSLNAAEGIVAAPIQDHLILFNLE